MKYEYRKATLNDWSGDLNKQWYIEFYAQNPAQNKPQRVREYKGFARCKTAQERHLYAENRITEINQLLSTGWSPFTESLFISKPGTLQEPVTVDKLNWKHYYTLFEKHIKTSGGSHRTMLTYSSRWNYFATWLELNKLTNIHPTMLNENKAMEFLTWLSDFRRVGANTRNAYHALLNSFYNWLIYQSNATTNPFQKHKHLRVSVKPKITFTEDEHKNLESIIKKSNPYLWLYTRMVYYCFLRCRSELTELRIGDIDFNSKTICLSGEYSKNNRADAVAVPDHLMTLLLQHKLNTYPKQYYVFTSQGPPGTKRVGKNTFANYFRKILDELNFAKGVGIYNFKHTGNKRLAAMGVPLIYIKLQNRHHSIEQTVEYMQDMYATDSVDIYKKFPKN